MQAGTGMQQLAHGSRMRRTGHASTALCQQRLLQDRAEQQLAGEPVKRSMPAHTRTLMITACSHSLNGVRFTPGHSWLYHLRRQLFCGDANKERAGSDRSGQQHQQQPHATAAGTGL